MHKLTLTLSLTVHIALLSCITTQINRTIPFIQLQPCTDVIDECLLKSPYTIRQFTNQSVMSWHQARALCFDPADDAVDGMATLDVSPSAIASTPLDEQFDLLRAICATLTNLDGRHVNCWVGGKINATNTGYVFSALDTNHLDYHIKNGDHDRWGCVRNRDGSCKKDIEGDVNNGEDYITLFQNRDYYFADWPIHGGASPDFQVTAVVCNAKDFHYVNRCQCFCDSCDIYGDPHVHTFDGLRYHLKGRCVYHAVSPCNISVDADGSYSKFEFNRDFPIEISTENAECFGGFSSCLSAVYVSFYNTLGVLQTVIRFAHKVKNGVIFTKVEFENEGELQLEGSVDLDTVQTWMQNTSEPWSFLLSQEGDYYQLGIWTHTKYQTARIEFRDLYGLDTTLLHLASSHMTLSACFANKTCGICGYYDDDGTNELVVRDAINSQLTTIITNNSLSDPFDSEAVTLISQFTDSWINYDRATLLDETCVYTDYYADLCQIEYCDDECICDGSAGIASYYNGSKQNQCNYDLAACLGFLHNSTQCLEWKASTQQQRTAYLAQVAAHCAHLVAHYCCQGSFCMGKPVFCMADTIPPTDKPSQTPTPGPTREPTAKPTELPTLAPTAGPTPSPSRTRPTPKPSDEPTNQPTTSPISDNLCDKNMAANFDIIFLVDNSCGLPRDECAKQQEGISEFLASIKGRSDPRVSYITFGDTQNIHTLVHLANDKYNDISDDDKGARNRLKFIKQVRDYKCGPLSGYAQTDLMLGINTAMNELRFGVNVDTINRDRKIVIFSNCEHDADAVDPCQLLGDDLVIEGKAVEVTVVNIAATGSEQPDFKSDTYLECLSDDEGERFIVLHNTSFSSFSRNINQFVSAVCENDTPSPQRGPTKHPTFPPTPPGPTRKPSENPSALPSSNPTLSPLQIPCGFNYDADIIFVVDASCGLNEKQCAKQQHFISDIMQGVKSSNLPRMSYIDCDNAYNETNSLLIRLNDAVFNHGTQLPNDEQLRSLYFELITERTKCNENSDTVPRLECINIALDEFKLLSNVDKKKKLVIYSACSSNSDVCELQSVINKQHIEVVLINVGDAENNENVCLLREMDRDLLYNLPDIDQWDSNNTKAVLSKVTNAICDEPTQPPTKRPTVKPTAVPTTNPVVTPTAVPLQSTTKPTPSPLEKSCKFKGEADIMLLVDTTCGLDAATCDVKRTFVSNLVQSIKKAHNPRIALVECGEPFGTEYSIKLSDPSFNDLNDDGDLSKTDRDNLYFTKIETHLQCLPGTSIPKRQCLSDAVDIFNTHKSDGPRIRKIVHIQICPNSDRQEVCRKKYEIFNNNIEIILVNIGDQITSGYNDCLFWNGEYNLFAFDDFDFDTPAAVQTTQQLIAHICTSNQFGIGGDGQGFPTAAPITKCVGSSSSQRGNKGGPCSDSDDANVPTPKPTWDKNGHTGKPTQARKPTKTWRSAKPTKQWDDSSESKMEISGSSSGKHGSAHSESASSGALSWSKVGNRNEISNDVDKDSSAKANKWPTKKNKPTAKPTRQKSWPSKPTDKQSEKQTDSDGKTGGKGKKSKDSDSESDDKLQWNKKKSDKNKNDFDWEFEDSSEKEKGDKRNGKINKSSS